MSCSSPLTDLCYPTQTDLSTDELEKKCKSYGTWCNVALYAALFFMALGGAALSGSQMHSLTQFIGVASFIFSILLISLAEFYLEPKMTGLIKKLEEREEERLAQEKKVLLHGNQEPAPELAYENTLFISDPSLTLEEFSKLSETEMIERVGKELLLDFRFCRLPKYRKKILNLNHLIFKALNALFRHWDLIKDPEIKRKDFILEFLELNTPKRSNSRFLANFITSMKTSAVDLSEVFASILSRLQEGKNQVLHVDFPLAYMNFIITKGAVEDRKAEFKMLFQTGSAPLFLSHFSNNLTSVQKLVLTEYFQGDEHGLSDMEISECKKLLL